MNKKEIELTKTVHCVKSETGDTGTTYKIFYCDEAGWSCSCPAFTFKRDVSHCKHIKRLLND